MSDKSTQFGAFIAARRREQKLSQETVAEHVGTTKSNVHAWEIGKHLPKAPALELLAEVLGVSYVDLFARAGYAYPDRLPEPAPYLRAKFRHLPEPALAEAERFFADLEARYEQRAKRSKRGPRGKRAR